MILITCFFAMLLGSVSVAFPVEKIPAADKAMPFWEYGMNTWTLRQAPFCDLAA